MNWKFWRTKEKEKESSQIEDLQADIASLHTQVESFSDQMKKMTRMQLKSSKNTEEKMEEFGSALALLDKQSELISQYEKRQEKTTWYMIRILDEFDHVSSGIKENEQVWQTVLDQWSHTTLRSLEGVGVFQVDVIGKTFNPEVAEAVQTAAKDELPHSPQVPYQVVEVLHRGYVSESGKVIRKAKVVTVEETKK